ncbi:hypothetical protein LCGC14_2903240 [marine sediment metagenome]|uniref:Uncharacterized protein n=1 Tax=marine sediment metagenome TaxID=412755 RepID=A0A0F8YFQ5_9ZZZZ
MAMEVVQLQKEMGIPSKCGLEQRPYSPGMWHAFWYGDLNEGLEGAQELYKKVERKVKEKFGIQTKVTLKRACTEMEVRGGPSEKWVYTEADGMLEILLDAFFTKDVHGTPQLAMCQARAYRLWIEEAFSRKDPTVWKYAEKNSFVQPSTTYEDKKLDVAKFPPQPSEWSHKEVEANEQPSGILRLPKN